MIIYIALVFVVMMTSGTIIIVSLQLDEEASVEDELAGFAEHIRTLVIHDALLVPDIDSIYDFEDLFSQRFEQLIHLPDGIQAFIISGQNFHTIESSVDDPAGEFNFFTTSVVIGAKAGEYGFDAGRTRISLFGGSGSWFEYAAPVFLEEWEWAIGNAPDYVIHVRKQADDFNARLVRTVQTIGIASVAAILIASVVGMFFSNSLTSQILLLNRKVKEFAAGQLSERIEVQAEDEIGQVTHSFNHMAEELSQTITAITNEKNKREIILYNMTDGVLAYDNNGHLVHSNHIAEELLGVKNIAQLEMDEMLKYIGIEAAPQGIENIADTSVAVDDKFINVNFNSYKNKDGEIEGIIIVFQDITKHMKLDNMRKEFVANVSHEVRTPLTTVKTYTETLLDAIEDDGEIDPAMFKNFLQTINAEADRMTWIVNDLLELSRFDSKRLEFEFKPFNLVELVRNNVSAHQITAEKQGKFITFYSGLNTADVVIDPERINQVLNNIISNSLRYSEEGAKVSVEVHSGRTSYLVYVSDTGIGIPKEDLRMIFERFYRVDKARSRELGGTGLGLSIAKEIMEAHDGRINCTSEEGVGTTMMLRFPKKD